MEITKRGNKIIVSKILRGNETYRMLEGPKFQTLTILRKPQICIGYSSKTKDNKHILLLDYDGCEKEIVLEDIDFLQKQFFLPTAYLFSTKKNSYHVVFLSKHTPKEAKELMENTHIDINFVNSPIRSKFRSWVLRIGNKKGSKKPKFIGIVSTQKNYVYQISTAHKMLLSKIFPKIKHPNYKNSEDGLKEVKIQEYETTV